MKHFSPEDLTVKVQEDFVEIHGKHNERQVSLGLAAASAERQDHGSRPWPTRGPPQAGAGWPVPTGALLGVPGCFQTPG